MDKTRNVVIFLPMAKDSVDRDFFECFGIIKTMLIANADKLPFKLGMIITYYAHTFPIDANRNECAWRAIDGIKLKDGSIFYPDITIWLDTYQTFPHHSLFTLLKHDLPIVAGVYYLKAKHYTQPFYPVIFKEGEDYQKRRMYKPVVEWPMDELFEVDFLGMGVVAIKTEVLAELRPPDKQFFKYQKHPEDGPSVDSKWKNKMNIQDVSEDSWFWRQVRKTKKYKIMIDPSVECGHIGKFVFTGEMYRAYVKEHRKQYIAQYGEKKYYEQWESLCKVEKKTKSEGETSRLILPGRFANGKRKIVV